MLEFSSAAGLLQLGHGQQMLIDTYCRHIPAIDPKLLPELWVASRETRYETRHRFVITSRRRQQTNYCLVALQRILSYYLQLPLMHQQKQYRSVSI